MDTSIVNVRRATDEEWDRIWRRCDYSTYFHSRQWIEIWSAYSAGKVVPDPQVICFSDARTALVPFALRTGYLRSYLSSPAGTYGGWISSDDLGVEHTVLLTGYMLRCKGQLFWRLNPYYPLCDAIEARGRREGETCALRLEGGFDRIVKGWTKGHRSAATKAKREGVTTRLAQAHSDWDDYYRMYEDSLLRWGDKASSRYPRRLFEIIEDTRSDNIKLWLADFHGRAIAGALCFYAGTHVVYWHGAALSDHFHLRPVHLLIHDVIKSASEGGAKWFDFNPSGGHEGVRKFKEGFGTESLRSDTVHCHTVPTFLHAQVIRSFIRVGKAVRLVTCRRQ